MGRRKLTVTVSDEGEQDKWPFKGTQGRSKTAAIQDKALFEIVDDEDSEDLSEAELLKDMEKPELDDEDDISMDSDVEDDNDDDDDDSGFELAEYSDDEEEDEDLVEPITHSRAFSASRPPGRPKGSLKRTSRVVTAKKLTPRQQKMQSKQIREAEGYDDYYEAEGAVDEPLPDIFPASKGRTTLSAIDRAEKALRRRTAQEAQMEEEKQATINKLLNRVQKSAKDVATSRGKTTDSLDNQSEADLEFESRSPAVPIIRYINRRDSSLLCFPNL